MFRIIDTIKEIDKLEKLAISRFIEDMSRTDMLDIQNRYLTMEERDNLTALENKISGFELIDEKLNGGEGFDYCTKCGDVICRCFKEGN